MATLIDVRWIDPPTLDWIPCIWMTLSGLWLALAAPSSSAPTLRNFGQRGMDGMQLPCTAASIARMWISGRGLRSVGARTSLPSWARASR